MGSFLGKGWVWIIDHRWRVVVGVLIVVGAGYYYFFYKSDQADQGGATFETGVVKRTDIRASVTGTGQVYAREQVDLKSVAAGDAIDVMSVHVKNDQEVKKGDLIAVLDTKDAAKEVRDAELSLRSAEIKTKQTEKLYNNETEDDKWQRQTQEVALAQARNKLSDARDDLRDYSIRAPFDGVVTGLSVAAGDSVSRSDVIASVISKKLYGSVLLNEIDAVGVRVGQKASLSFEALSGEMVSGKVSKVDTIGTVSQNVVSYGVEIEFDEQPAALKPGMSVDVEIVTEEKLGALAVPVSAVKSDEQGSFVLVPKAAGWETESKSQTTTDGASSARKGTGSYQNLPYRPMRVGVGASDGSMTEIISGLSEGDAIVTKTSSASTASGSGSSQTKSNSLIPMGAGSGSGMRLH